MLRKSAYLSLAACAAWLPPLLVPAGAAAQTPAYQINLRSRTGHVTPERTRDSQTAGGFIQVTQLEPNVVMVHMRGAVAARTERCKEAGAASMKFELDQDFEIIPTRKDLRPPRLMLAGWLLGTLQSSDKAGGSAENAPACASVKSGGQPLLHFCVEPHAVATAQTLFVNDRQGPLEVVVAAGGYTLHQTFAISASQPHCYCHPDEAAAADFDPEPRFDSHFEPVMKPFRAVPARDFGFRVVVQVVEDLPSPVGGPAGGTVGGGDVPERLPPPTKLEKKQGTQPPKTPTLKQPDRNEGR